MKKLLGLLFGLFITMVAALSSDFEEWNTYKLKYGKNYQNETEEKIRMEIFLKNKHKIDVHNDRHTKGLVTYKMGLNKYSDLSDDEFNGHMKGVATPRLRASMNYWNKRTDDFLGSQHKLGNRNLIRSEHIPDSIDWRDEGAVNSAADKVQGDCRSSWAFATTGAIEGQLFRKNGKLPQLSEQNLIDCATVFGRRCDCDGCSLGPSWLYVELEGINTVDDYPTTYKAKEGDCQFSSTNAITISLNNQLTAGDELKLREAIATIGPIAVRIDGSHNSLKHYSGGIYYEPECSSHNLNLDVLAVGYGTNESGEHYYILKNWLGADWGEDGYFKLARDKCNHCGVASVATYPVL